MNIELKPYLREAFYFCSRLYIPIRLHLRRTLVRLYRYSAATKAQRFTKASWYYVASLPCGNISLEQAGLQLWQI